jgi:hypothetical protein
LLGDRWGALLDLGSSSEGEYCGHGCVDHRHHERRKPRGHHLVEQQDHRGREGAEGEQRDRAAAADQSHPDACGAPLLDQLGPRERELLLDERRGLVGELAHQLPDRPFVLTVVGRHR